jgi:hypothetical protein
MTEQAAIDTLAPRRAILSRHQIGLQVHARLDCGHERNERVTFNGPRALEVAPGERARCFDCGQVAAGLMPTEEQLRTFRRQHGSE